METKDIRTNSMKSAYTFLNTIQFKKNTKKAAEKFYKKSGENKLKRF